MSRLTDETAITAFVAAWSTGATGREVGSQLILRTARKPHSCRSWEWDATSEHKLFCGVLIEPGERYVEYLGESAGYQSGMAMCLRHAARDWGATEWIYPIRPEFVELERMLALARDVSGFEVRS